MAERNTRGVGRKARQLDSNTARLVDDISLSWSGGVQTTGYTGYKSGLTQRIISVTSRNRLDIMSYCTACGEELQQDSSFCHGCGEELSDSNSENAPNGVGDSKIDVKNRNSNNVAKAAGLVVLSLGVIASNRYGFVAFTLFLAGFTIFPQTRKLMLSTFAGRVYDFKDVNASSKSRLGRLFAYLLLVSGGIYLLSGMLLVIASNPDGVGYLLSGGLLMGVGNSMK